ncbi:MAG: hypothetical protein HRU41_37520 [Saprospiraceae bacterium]|nr:hypothetical protein [Saprospiraceae bacterium]
MLLIISTFFGLCWLVQYRSFRKQEQTLLQASTSAKVIVLQEYLATKTQPQASQESKFHTPINLKKAK